MLITSTLVNVRQIRCQADLNSFPLGELEETTGTPRTMWMKTTQQDLESLNLSLNEAVDVNGAKTIHYLSLCQ